MYTETIKNHDAFSLYTMLYTLLLVRNVKSASSITLVERKVTKSNQVTLIIK